MDINKKILIILVAFSVNQSALGIRGINVDKAVTYLKPKQVAKKVAELYPQLGLNTKKITESLQQVATSAEFNIYHRTYARRWNIPVILEGARPQNNGCYHPEVVDKVLSKIGNLAEEKAIDRAVKDINVDFYKWKVTSSNRFYVNYVSQIYVRYVSQKEFEKKVAALYPQLTLSKDELANTLQNTLNSCNFNINHWAYDPEYTEERLSYQAPQKKGKYHPAVIEDALDGEIKYLEKQRIRKSIDKAVKSIPTEYLEWEAPAKRSLYELAANYLNGTALAKWF